MADIGHCTGFTNTGPTSGTLLGNIDSITTLNAKWRFRIGVGFPGSPTCGIGHIPSPAEIAANFPIVSPGPGTPAVVGPIGQSIAGLLPNTNYLFFVEILDSSLATVLFSQWDGNCNTVCSFYTGDGGYPNCATTGIVTADFGGTINGFITPGAKVRARYGNTTCNLGHLPSQAEIAAFFPNAGPFHPITGNGFTFVDSFSGLVAFGQYYSMIEIFDSTGTIPLFDSWSNRGGLCGGMCTIAGGATGACPASSLITSTSATLSGSTIDNMPATLKAFIGVSLAPGGPYTAFTGPSVVGNNTVGQPVPALNLVGLTPGTTYYYAQIIQDVATSTTLGVRCAASFTTVFPPAPVITTSPGANVCGVSLIPTSSSLGPVTASVNPGGAATTVRIAYGPTIAYGSFTVPVAVGSGVVNVPFSDTITGLAPATLYHFRIEATNVVGTTVSSDFTCTTLGVPNITATKTTPAGPYTIGSPIVSTLTVINNGTAAGTVNVTDPIPAAPPGTTRSFISFTGGAGALGNTPAGITGINDNLTINPGGGFVTYTITDTPIAVGNYQNNAQLNGGPNIPGGPPFPVIPAPTPILTLTKTTVAGPYTVGVPITSTLIASNTGTAAGVSTVIDNIPAAPPGTTRTFTAVAVGGATGFTAAGVSNINDVITMPAGSTVTYTINDTPTTTGTYQNRATLNGGPFVPGGPIAPVNPAPAPIITATKSTASGPYTVGIPITSTIVVGNAGTATGAATVVDPIPALPAGTTRTFTAVATGGATGFTPAGVGNINDVLTVPVGATVTYTINDTPIAVGTYQNIVTVNGTPFAGGPITPVSPPPSGVCGGTTNITSTSFQMGASISGSISAAFRGHFEWGVTPGGPYPLRSLGVPGNNTVGQIFSAVASPLSSATTFYWRFVITLADDVTIFDATPECDPGGTTTLPPSVTDCPPFIPLSGPPPAPPAADVVVVDTPCDVLLVSSGWCDLLNVPVDVIYNRSCVNGATTVEYRNPSTGALVAPAFPLKACDTGVAFEQVAVCDVDPVTGSVIATYIVRTVYDEVTNTFTTTFVNISTGLPYVPTGVPRFCGDGISVEQQIICVKDVAPASVAFQALLSTQYMAGGFVSTYLNTLDGANLPIPGWGTTVLISDECPAPNPVPVTDSWGQELVSNAVWASPADVTSVSVTALDAGPSVVVNAGAAVVYRAAQTGVWSEDGTNTTVKPAGYVTVTTGVGVQAFVTWQTRP